MVRYDTLLEYEMRVIRAGKRIRVGPARQCKLYDCCKIESQPGRKGTTVIASLILRARQTHFLENQVRKKERRVDRRTPDDKA
jgi:hypothetical protein